MGGRRESAGGSGSEGGAAGGSSGGSAVGASDRRLASTGGVGVGNASEVARARGSSARSSDSIWCVIASVVDQTRARSGPPLPDKYGDAATLATLF